MIVEERIQQPFIIMGGRRGTAVQSGDYLGFFDMADAVRNETYAAENGAAGVGPTSHAHKEHP